MAKHGPGMETHIKQCNRLLRFKSRPQQTELHPIIATHLKELEHMDFLTIESGKADKDVNILVVTNHYMRHVQAFITPTQTVRVVAETL